MHENLTHTSAAAQSSLFPRAALARAVQALIDLLDELDGDPDFEETDAEDELLSARAIASAESDFPSCPVADPGEHALPERHGKQPKLKQSPIHEDREDDDPGEDDDPAGGNIVDEPHDQESDDEPETWSHPDDHPAELFVGRRPANDAGGNAA